MNRASCLFVASHAWSKKTRANQQPFFQSITEYLTKTNVQLGATYKTSKISTALYNEGYKAAAEFVNARPDEVRPLSTLTLNTSSFQARPQSHTHQCSVCMADA